MIPKYVFEETCLAFLEPVKAYLLDASVSEVMINGPDTVYIERKGKIESTDAKFSSVASLEAALKNLAQFVGKQIDPYHPILEAHLPDGSRVEAVMPPIAEGGPCVAIRKFSKTQLSLDKLIEYGSLTESAKRFIEALVAHKKNIMVAGGTGSGKTSLLSAVAGLASTNDRVVVLEDTRELNIPLPHVVYMEARPADIKGRGQVTIRDLFRATLRMRPDRIVVGEIRGAEALELIQAMTSGHGGCLSTLHATYPKDALHRLETMGLMSDVELPLVALRAQVASAIDFVIQTSRFADGSRGVTHITEVLGYDSQAGYQLSDIFLRQDETLNSTGRKPSAQSELNSECYG